MALGLTHATMMAGVVSANVLIVALASDVLRAGARGLGFLEAGWGAGAIVGGLLASQLSARMRMPLYVLAMAGLAVGHVAMPFVTFLFFSIFLQAVFGFCRALGGVVAQSTVMHIVPRHFMGRTQSAFAIATTVLQVMMSFALGWLTQNAGIVAGFALLALLYVGAMGAAIRARQLVQ